MTAYRYRALNPGGKLVRGVLEADSERQVRSQLRARQLRPVEVQTAARAEAANQNLRQRLFPMRIKGGELALLTRQLATLVQSNLPLADCLQAAAEQTRRPRTKAMLLQVRSRVSEGHTLAYALAEYPQVFNEMYRAMVSAGEHAGFLGPVLEQLAVLDSSFPTNCLRACHLPLRIYCLKVRQAKVVVFQLVSLHDR